MKKRWLGNECRGSCSGIAAIPLRNKSVSNKRGHGGGGKRSYLGYILKADPTEFPDGFDVG